MADKNNNGIPDSLETKKPPKKAPTQNPNGNSPERIQGGGLLSVAPPSFTAWDREQAQKATPRAMGGTPVSYRGNYGPAGLGLSAPAKGAPSGGGTQAWNGSLKAPSNDWWNYQNGQNVDVEKIGSMFPGSQVKPAPEQPKTLADYIQQAIALIGDQGQQALVSYDPQRSTLRGNASENDARLEAMYRQLRGSIDADAPVLQQGYQEAIDSTANRAREAQTQTQQASDAATAQNNAVLSNLGIQEAQIGQIQQGRDLGTQTAENIAAQASKGQAAGDRLSSNQATALAHNTNIGNAAGLEGNLQRAANNAKLQALLADIDMQEQSQNTSIRNANSQNGFAQQLSVAQQLLDFDRYNQDREDGLQQSAAELAAESSANQAEQLPDLGSMLQALGQDASWLTQDPGSAARLLDVLRKLDITQ
jgi:hypothetical protein